MPPHSFLLPLLFSSSVFAAIFPLHVHVGHPSPSVARRAPSVVDITNTQNAQYVINMTIAGTPLPVLLDTGSSDLWAYFKNGITSPNEVVDTFKSVQLKYAVGEARGHVKTAPITVGNLTVPDQAFLHVTDVSTFNSKIEKQSYSGLLGLGPNSGSVIRKRTNKKGPFDSFLQRVFVQDKTANPFVTFLLDRKEDPADPFKGQFSIEEVIPGFENITSMPKLDVEKVNRLLSADQHWQVLTDEDNGIIGPDGNPIRIKSIVPKAPKGQFVAVIDSGFTFSQVPRDVSDAIYGRVQGAFYDTKNEYWILPCGQYLNISFNFGGRNYPIHPLDTVDMNFNAEDASGRRMCIGAFQPITSAFSILGHYDMILGMSFLRNAYTLLDFGDWIKGTDDRGDPYIQMASITNPAAARQDFIQTRLGGTDTTSDAKFKLLPADQGQKSPISEAEKKKRYQEMILSRWPYIVLGSLALLVLSVGCCIWKCRARRRRSRDQGLASNSRLGFMRREKDDGGAMSDMRFGGDIRGSGDRGFDALHSPSKKSFNHQRDDASVYSYSSTQKHNPNNSSSAYLLGQGANSSTNLAQYPTSPSQAYNGDYSRHQQPPPRAYYAQ